MTNQIKEKPTTCKLLVAGFGGQGVMVCGQIISYTAIDTTDLNVVYYPAYGVEQRGGTANCFLTLSSDEIGEPKPPTCDYLIVMNNASLDKFLGNLVPGGTVFYNSDVVTKEITRTDIKAVAVPANKIAIDAGSEKSANITMAGSFVGYTNIIPKENVLETIHKKLGTKRPQLNPINDKAFLDGFEVGAAGKLV